jgi:hypothetical protein
MQSVIVHVLNEEPIAGELDEMPSEHSQIISLKNPRRKDGKDIHFLDEGVTTMILPWHRINFIQVMPTGGIEDVIGFVRE